MTFGCQPDSTIPPPRIPPTDTATNAPSHTTQKSTPPDEACTQRRHLPTRHVLHTARGQVPQAFRRISNRRAVRTNDEITVKGPSLRRGARWTMREPGLLHLKLPRHDFLAELARLQLPPECILIRETPPRTRQEALARPDSTALDRRIVPWAMCWAKPWQEYCQNYRRLANCSQPAIGGATMQSSRY